MRLCFDCLFTEVLGPKFSFSRINKQSSHARLSRSVSSFPSSYRNPRLSFTALVSCFLLYSHWANLFWLIDYMVKGISAVCLCVLGHDTYSPSQKTVLWRNAMLCNTELKFIALFLKTHHTQRVKVQYFSAFSVILKESPVFFHYRLWVFDLFKSQYAGLRRKQPKTKNDLYIF